MGAEGIEPSNDGLEPSSLPLAYAPINKPRKIYFYCFPSTFLEWILQLNILNKSILQPMPV